MLSGWHKSIPSAERASAGGQGRIALASRNADPIFLRDVARWDLRQQRMLFQILIPIGLLVKHQIDPVRLTDAGGLPIAFARPGANQDGYRFELYHTGDASEPMGELELADTQFNQIEVVWVTLQDPLSVRYDVDVLPGGESTLRGTAGRNLVSEEAAMLAGLAPGQVRRGLGVFGLLVERIELMMLCLNQREYLAQPLFYHMAVLFEQHGFSYVQGQSLMDEIHEGFIPGGCLAQKLDGSTPFRRPEQRDTIRGRSWAIHDGVMADRWDRVRMVKRLGVGAHVCTAPDINW